MKISSSHSEPQLFVKLPSTNRTVRFDTSVPDMCKLLRSKLFPHSPFTEDENDSDAVPNHSPSPPARSSKHITSKTSKEHSQRSSSVLSSTAKQDSRSRSRSLSVSLAQDGTAKRSNTGASTTLKRALSREVSMSRSFKPRPNTAPKGTEGSKSLQPQPIPDVGQAKRSDIGVTLVTATPTKSRLYKPAQNTFASQVYSSPKSSLDPF